MSKVIIEAIIIPITHRRGFCQETIVGKIQGTEEFISITTPTDGNKFGTTKKYQITITEVE